MSINFADAMTVHGLRHLYLRRELKPEQVIEEILQKVKNDHSKNIWITPPTWEFIKPYLDQLNKWNIEEKPLWGIPFAIKDNIELAGVLMTVGCPDYAYVPKEHATVVKYLIEAGAIPLGKTNLDQFATGLVGTRSPYGETHNALKEQWISGGSSSGSAVAVARGHCAFAIGTDTAGSGRVPASLNRIFGFKPRLGSWSKRGVVPACESIDSVSLFANSVEEILYIDRIVRAEDLEDPWSEKAESIIPRLPSRILIPEGPVQFFGQMAEKYKTAWNQSLERLRSLGIPVFSVNESLFNQASSILYEGPWISERWVALGQFIESHAGSLHSVTEQVLRSGAPSNYTANDVFQAIHRLQRLKREAQALLKDAIVVFPTNGGTWTRQEVASDPIRTNQAMGLYTNHCNLLGLTALALPSVDAADDMPFGITFFALAEQESLLFGAGRLWAPQPTDQLTDLSNISQSSSKDKVLVAVCGLHMRGFPLEKQMIEHGAEFLRETMTAPKYRFIKLPTSPPKPGLIKLNEGGVSIQLEIWQMPSTTFGSFTAAIPAPLGIGKIELLDGTIVSGFLCESYASTHAEDLSAYGGWRAAVKSSKIT
jgi:allophanate hydrolase